MAGDLGKVSCSSHLDISVNVFTGSAGNPVLVTDSEVELAGNVSRGIKTTEAFEMKNMPRVD